MTQNPFTAVFDAQRTAIEQSRSASHDVLEAQKASFSAVGDAVEQSSSLAEQNADLTKGAVFAYFDALEAAAPEGAADFDDLREFVEESFEAGLDAQHQSAEAVIEALEESEVVYDEFAANYVEAVDDSFDAFLEVHEQAETNAVSVAENVEDAADEFDASA